MFVLGLLVSCRLPVCLACLQSLRELVCPGIPVCPCVLLWAERNAVAVFAEGLKDLEAAALHIAEVFDEALEEFDRKATSMSD